MNHAERQHALLSASGAQRWLTCTPSARLEDQFPDEISEAAAEGTLAHELCELKLRHYFFTPDFTKAKYTRAVNKLKKDPIWEDEMNGCTDEYLDYIKSCAMGFPAPPTVRIEDRVNFSKYTCSREGDPIEGTGIADCILISGDLIQVIDFKYGKGVPVSADHNPQLMLYALGAYDGFRLLYGIHRVKLSIVQPRLNNIDEWECGLEELLKFGTYAKMRAALAWEGKGPFAPGEAQCRFCRARKQCRAWSDHNVKQAFQIGELPPLIDAGEAGKRLLALESVVKYQKDLQEWALGECLAGKAVPGWKAVEGRGSRDWTDMEQAFAVLQNNSIPRAVLYEEHPLTLAQVEKAIGKQEFKELVGDFVQKNPGKPALVKESDKRPAITNRVTAKEAFKEADPATDQK